MTNNSIRSAIATVLNAGNVHISSEVLEQVVKAAALTANNQALHRFNAQFELLSGGPEEIGKHEFREISAMAEKDLFEAIAHVQQEYQWTIGLGPYVIQVSEDGASKEYYNTCFGAIEDWACATGYSTQSEAETEAESLDFMSYKIVRFEDCR